MSSKSKKKRMGQQKKNPPAAPPPPPPVMSSGAWALGIVLLLVCVAASLMLVLEHFAFSLPGCGPQSGCAKAAASVWGKIPGVDWPTSFVGFAYFLGILGTWLTWRRGLPANLRWLIRLGALASVGFIVIMIAGGYFCPYCGAAHAANIAFLILLERSTKAQASAMPALAVVAALFLVSSGVLWPINTRHQAQQAARNQEQFQQSVENITAGGGSEQAAPVDAKPFTGRHRRGPENAPIRIVIFTDYQCPDCRTFEPQLERIVATRDDVSLSVRYNPFSATCNKYIGGANPHPNACWAARAAEAAGILRGDEGFWEMHRWLFQQKGEFTSPVLQRQLRQLGYEPSEFIAVMTGDETEQRVLADIDEAHELGVMYTPMIFINGRQLYWLGVPNALGRAIEALAATNPPPGSPADDRPLAAPEKYIEDWRQQPEQSFAAGDGDWALGASDAEASVRIVVWGDYQEEHTVELDRRMRALLGSVPTARYTFRHYPFDQSCNSNVHSTRHPLACLAARAAEAAGRLGGNDAYWRMHGWLLQNQALVNEATLPAAARDIGLDPDALLTRMESMEVAEAIRQDAAAAKRLQPQRLPIPMLYVDGRHVPRWRLDGERIPERIVEEAASD